VDDVDLVACPARPHVDVLPKLADFVDAAVAGPVDLQHVHVVAAAHRLADVALVARLRRRTALAVVRFAQDARGRGLAYAAGPGEEIGVPHAPAGDRPGQRPRHVL